jgi:hypothetical protein
MRRKARTDSNQSSIVSALRDIPGVSVAVTSSLGQGYPDLNIGRNGITYLVELKDGSLPPSKKQLTDDEKEFKDRWTGHYSVCENIDDILKVIGIK